VSKRYYTRKGRLREALDLLEIIRNVKSNRRC